MTFLLQTYVSAQVEQSQTAFTRKQAVARIKNFPAMTWDATNAFVLYLRKVIKDPVLLKDKLGEGMYHLKEVGSRSWSPETHIQIVVYRSLQF